LHRAGKWTLGSFHRELDRLVVKYWQAPRMSETNPSDNKLGWKPELNITVSYITAHMVVEHCINGDTSFLWGE